MLLVSAIVLLLAASAVSAQTTPASQTEVAKVSTASSTASNNGSSLRVFTDYREVRIGMSADEVKTKLKNLKDGGTGQDFFVFSEGESAQIYYDENKKVMAISIDYIGDSTNAPSPSSVLGIELEAKPDGSMMIAVKDSGKGISEADVSHVFEKFYRGSQEIGETSRGTAAPGVGLGLYLAQHIVRQLDGEISVESELGRGTTFKVLLPLWEDNDVGAGKERANAEALVGS
jgi:light-regulated signal transduction histidine kinase (bacteriophytochrome)